MKDHDEDREDAISMSRRAALGCLGWAGSGVLWTMVAGIPTATALTGSALAATHSKALSFVQISDTHVGFSKEANPDVTGTLEATIARVNAMHPHAAFVLHTGDVSHLSKPEEFGKAAELFKGIKTAEMHVVPGEHDALDADKTQFFKHYGKPSKNRGWYSFDHAGVHFIALVNVMAMQPGGLGRLGPEQIAWLKKDLHGRSASQPIIAFAHIPLFALYPEWGWGTDDAEEAVAVLRPFGSVTVLNGHVHQIAQKVEGNIRFYTARSTAYPQPAPGTAKGPGPMTVEASQLRTLLGLRSVSVSHGAGVLALTDQSLSA